VYGLCNDKVAERLLKIKRLKWQDTELSFVPKPRSRRAVIRPVSLPEEDKTEDHVAVSTGEDSCGDCSTNTDDDEQFYDAETSHESMKTCSEDDDSSRGVEKEGTVLKEPSQHTETSKMADISPTPNSTEDTQKVECVKLPLVKLNLLKKLIKKQKICKQCEVKVDLECEEAVLTGTANDILTMNITIFEAMANAGQRRVNISKELGRFITSLKGQEWFDDYCESCSLVGICYVDNLVTNVLAANDEMADALQKRLSDELLSERISIESHHLAFLESPSWMDFVRKFTDTHLVVITADAHNMAILVEGVTGEVKNAVKEVDALLNIQCHVNKRLSLKPADFRTLSFRGIDIINKAQELVKQQQR